jgi:hypothetical protein
LQRILNYVNAGFLLLAFGAPIPIMLGIVPNYLALRGSGLLWGIAAVLFIISTAVFWQSAKLNRQNPPAGFAPQSARKTFWVTLMVIALYAVFVPLTVVGAMPAYATYVWTAPQTETVTVKDATVSSTGRYACDGAIRIDAWMFLSRICGVPEDLRSQMKPGDQIEVTGPGHALGLRAETVRLLP